MTLKQALRVAARESKAVRRSLIDKLEQQAAPKSHSCEHEPMPWLPEIIDYLREDVSCIFKEIDEWEWRNSLSNADLLKENNLQEPCHE